MRPDEELSLKRIERDQQFNENLKGVGKTISKTIVGAGAAGAFAKISPFLSEFITPELALKGINKVSPKLGQFLKNGMDKGLSLKSGLEFIKKQMQPQQSQTKQSIIEQYSPELFNFLKQYLDQGRTPEQAGALAQLNKKFLPIIKKMEQDHKAPFSAILMNTFGSPQQAQPQQTAQQPQQSQTAKTGQQQQLTPEMQQLAQVMNQARPFLGRK